MCILGTLLLTEIFSAVAHHDALVRSIHTLSAQVVNLGLLRGFLCRNVADACCRSCHHCYMNLGVGAIACRLCRIVVRRIPVGEIEISTHSVELKSGTRWQIFQIVASSCADVLILLAAAVRNKSCCKFTIRILSILLATIQSAEKEITTILSLYEAFTS